LYDTTLVTHIYKPRECTNNYIIQGGSIKLKRYADAYVGEKLIVIDTVRFFTLYKNDADPKLGGSYNLAETNVMGRLAHEFSHISGWTTDVLPYGREEIQKGTGKQNYDNGDSFRYFIQDF